jgi:hypothetical protein
MGQANRNRKNGKHNKGDRFSHLMNFISKYPYEEIINFNRVRRATNKKTIKTFMPPNWIKDTRRRIFPVFPMLKEAAGGSYAN